MIMHMVAICLARALEGGKNMAATMSIDKKKKRADEALKVVNQLSGEMQKAVYIATCMFLAEKETESIKEKGTAKK